MKNALLLSVILASLGGMPAFAQAPGTPGTAAPARPQPPGTTAARDTSRVAGTGILRGRVVGADGRPIRKAQIRLVGAEVRESRVAQTDADGRYEIKELPAGRFQITAFKAGYVQLQYGQLRAFEGGRPVDLRAAETIENINFTLPRGGVITGRVIDELGEPVVDAQVSAMRFQFVQGRRRLGPVGRQSTTNDIGEFRLFGLLPGEYYLSASIREMNLTVVLAGGGLPESTDSRTGYAPTYYPATTRAADAEKVTVGVGQTINELQIALSPIRTARISGTVTNTEGALVTTGAVAITVKGDPSINSASAAPIDTNGRFVANGLSPGDYMLMAVAGNPLGGALEFATAEVTLAGEDVTNLQLNGVKPITVTGRITPPSTPERTLPLAGMNVTAIAVNPDDQATGAAGPGKVNPDQTFEIKMLPGRSAFRLGGAAGNWVIRTVRYNGEDVTETGVDFKPGRDVSGVEIELTNVPTTFTGAVTDARGQQSKDYVVVVFTQNEDRWTPTTRMIAISRPDQEGRFRIRVPGGNYHAAAVDYLEPGEQYDPEFLAKIRSQAAPLVIASGEAKTMDLKLQQHP